MLCVAKSIFTTDDIEGNRRIHILATVLEIISTRNRNLNKACSWVAGVGQDGKG